MARLKEGFTIVVVPDADGEDTRFAGVIDRDTQYLSRLDWKLPSVTCLSRDLIEDRLIDRFAAIGDERRQLFAVERTLRVQEQRVTDSWSVWNTSEEPREWSQAFAVSGALADLFARFVSGGEVMDRPIETELMPNGVRLTRTTLDDRKIGVTLTLPGAASISEDELVFTCTVPARQTRELVLTVEVDAGTPEPDFPPLPTYADWRERFDIEAPAQWKPAFDRAVDDLRSLLLRTSFGPYPAAGLPWFGNVFGRDALITGMMILPWAPDLMKAVLDLLAAHQGTSTDPFREEEPGKILHEMREGELSRSDRIPFARYYGSVDATALFVVAISEYLELTDDYATVARLRPAADRALQWITNHLDGATGLLRFQASGSGLVVQSWKDSHDSMNHADGTSAPQPLAVAEVQGYAFAAFQAAASLATRFDEPDEAEKYAGRAEALAASFHGRYWLPGLATYAMALDGELQPLRVQSSDPGHLLWSGIVPEEIAPVLVRTLMSDDLWSGWGLRTLGAAEVRYAPTSYHNGSVWPHDTALFAAGLARYGFADEFGVVMSALFDLAMQMPDHRIPELISGHPRSGRAGPVAYAQASSPQAWAAAALPMLLRLNANMGPRT